MVTGTESHTTLHGSALWLARIVWVAMTLFCIAYYLYWTVTTVVQPLPVCTTPPSSCNPYYLGVEDVAVMGANAPLFEWIGNSFAILNALASLTFVVVGLVIVWRKSNDWMALLISAMLISLGAVGISPATAQTIPPGTLLYWVVAMIGFIGYFGPFSALFYFPDGQFVPRWTRPVCIALVAIVFLFFLAGNALVLPDVLWILFALLIATWALCGIGSMVYRYRQVATPLQRQQVKWVALGLLLAACSVAMWAFYAALLPPDRPSPTRTVIVAFTFPLVLLFNVFFPISVAIAMVRYRLWDIDVLIRRTVTYALVVALLGGVYFGSVILLQQIFAGITGQREEFITVLSTLAIAALFVPLRNRIQSEIDKRFNRKKYDAQQVLQNFGETVRDETDLEKLSAELLNVVNETMQPKSVSLWLRREGRETRVPRKG